MSGTSESGATRGATDSGDDSQNTPFVFESAYNSDSGSGGGITRREYYLTVSAGSVQNENRTFSEFVAVVEQEGSSVFTSLKEGFWDNINGGQQDNNANNLSSGGPWNNRLSYGNFSGGVGSSGVVGGGVSDIETFYEQLLRRVEFKMGDEMTRYVCPAIIVLGNLSNLAAFLVLCRKKFKSSSVAFYMCAYALANLLFLDLMLGIAWLCFIYEIPYLSHRTDWGCRLWTFITNVITYSGIWFVVVMSIDRIIYTNVPSKASSYCTVFSAKAIVSFVLIGLIVVSIHAMWTFDLQPQGCWVPYQQDDLHTLTWPWWSATIYSYIPLVLLFLQIIALSVTLCMRTFRKHSPTNGHRAGDPETFIRPVFIITVAFFFLTVPSTVINLLDIHLPTSLLKVDVIAKIELTKKITEILSSLNNSLLGIVLFVCSADFRTEFVSLVTGLPRQIPSLVRRLFCCGKGQTFCCERCGGNVTFMGVFEMRTMSNSEDSSPHIQVDYELCNNNDENLVTNV